MDETTIIAFEKAHRSKPKLHKVLEYRHRSTMMMCRKWVRQRLEELAVVPSAECKNLGVHFRVSHYGPTLLSFQLRDPAGKGFGTAMVECWRMPAGDNYDLPVFHDAVDLKQLLAVVSHGESANIVFEELDNNTALRITETEADFRSIALLALFSTAVPPPTPPRGLGVEALQRRVAIREAHYRRRPVSD